MSGYYSEFYLAGIVLQRSDCYCWTQFINFKSIERFSIFALDFRIHLLLRQANLNQDPCCF